MSASEASSITPSPSFPPQGSLFLKGIDTTNTAYKLSYERTRVAELPFPHPKYHIHPNTEEVYEVTSPIFEEYDPVSGYVDSVGPVIESVEHSKERGEDGEEPREAGRLAWAGYVQWPESKERSSIAREAKRARGSEGEDERGGDEGNDSVRRSKRSKQMH